MVCVTECIVRSCSVLVSARRCLLHNASCAFSSIPHNATPEFLRNKTSDAFFLSNHRRRIGNPQVNRNVSSTPEANSTNQSYDYVQPMAAAFIGEGTMSKNRTTFRLGEKQWRQSNSKYNFMQYVFFFEKKVYTVYNGVWDKAPEAGEFSRIFVLKVTLQPVTLLLTVTYRFYRKMGKQNALIAPQ